MSRNSLNQEAQDKERAEDRRIELQGDAEVALGRVLEASGVDPMQFMTHWNMSHHQFNVLAHYLHGVNDEEPILPPMLKALLLVADEAATLRQRHEPALQKAA